MGAIIQHTRNCTSSQSLQIYCSSDGEETKAKFFQTRFTPQVNHGCHMRCAVEATNLQTIFSGHSILNLTFVFVLRCLLLPYGKCRMLVLSSECKTDQASFTY